MGVLVNEKKLKGRGVRQSVLSSLLVFYQGDRQVDSQKSGFARTKKRKSELKISREKEISDMQDIGLFRLKLRGCSWENC